MAHFLKLQKCLLSWMVQICKRKSFIKLLLWQKRVSLSVGFVLFVVGNLGNNFQMFYTYPQTLIEMIKAAHNFDWTILKYVHTTNMKWIDHVFD